MSDSLIDADVNDASETPTAARDIADVPAVEVIGAAVINLMSAAAVKWLALIGSQVVRASTDTKTRAALPQTRPTPRI